MKITGHLSRSFLNTLMIFILISLVIIVPYILSGQSNTMSSVWAKTGLKLPSMFEDKGVFSDLNDEVEIHIPSWLVSSELHVRSWMINSQKTGVGLFYGEELLVILPSHQGDLTPSAISMLDQYSLQFTKQEITPLPKLFSKSHDQDYDGIFDLLDIHRGAVKATLNGAEYQEGYERLSYPLGDVSRKIGVCTDVVVRAFRNAGWDLQKLVYEDMKKRPKAYGLKGKKPNRHIDHRRVRRLNVYFKKHYHSLPISFDPKQRGNEAWLPGDLIFMDTLGKGRPTHVGLVSDKVGWNGQPLIINNWTYGYQTSEMDLSGLAKYMYRFRMTYPK